MQLTAADIRRFEAFILPEPNSGCWLFDSAPIGAGYGQFSIGGRDGTTEYAHRVAYSIWVGEIPPGMDVLHRCDVPCCVNPRDLFLGDQLANMRDMAAKGRHRLNNRPLENSIKTHCAHGHELAGANLWIRRDGARICKACRARIARKWRHQLTHGSDTK